MKKTRIFSLIALVLAMLMTYGQPSGGARINKQFHHHPQKVPHLYPEQYKIDQTHPKNEKT